MCGDCKECLSGRKDEFKNIQEVVENIKEGTQLEIKTIDQIHKVTVKINYDNEITINDGDNEDYLCNLLDFAYEIKINKDSM